MVKNKAIKKQKINKHKVYELVKVLNNKVNVLDLIRAMNLPIEKRGNIYQTFCLYHEDKTSPNFTYFADREHRNFFHCFCCKINKGPVNIWKDYYNKTTTETLEDLARLINFDLTPYYKPPTPDDIIIEKVQEVKELVAKYCHDRAKYNPNVMTYLSSRYSMEVIDQWMLGYGGKHSDLYAYLTKKEKCSITSVKAAGITKDLFEDRIIHPLHDMHGNVVGFTTRVWGKTPEEEQKKREKSPKYNNTFNSKYFNKSSSLYGLHFAREAMRMKEYRTKTMILVEGHPDVIAMHSHGFKNTVGLMSCGFTVKAANILARAGVESVIICLDGDKAGRDGTIRILKLEAELNSKLKQYDKYITPMKFYAVALPWGNDPDEFLKDGENVIKLQRMLKKPMSCLDFFVNAEMRNANFKTITDKLEFIYKLKNTLLDFIKPAVLKMTEKHLLDNFGLTSEDLYLYTCSHREDEASLYEEGLIIDMFKNKSFRKTVKELAIPEWCRSRMFCLFKIILLLDEKDAPVDIQNIIYELKRLGYAHFFKDEREVSEILSQKRGEPDYAAIGKMRENYRKRLIAQTLTKICNPDNNWTELEILSKAAEFIKKMELKFS